MATTMYSMSKLQISYYLILNHSNKLIVVVPIKAHARAI